MKTILTIGGTDVCSGSGIQADMKTILVNGCYGTSAVTAITVFDRERSGRVMSIPADLVREQLEACINNAKPNAVKIGMLSDVDTVRTVAEVIRENDLINIVLNPILISPEGKDLVPREVFRAVKDELLPLADFLTPDISELEYFSSKTISTKENVIDASKALSEKYGCTVATKCGRIAGDAADLFFRDGYYKWFPGMIIRDANLHDAGNTIACAVAVNLAKGYEPDKAFKCAKDFVTQTLLNMVTFGSGLSFLDHNALVNGTFMGVLTDDELSRM